MKFGIWSVFLCSLLCFVETFRLFHPNGLVARLQPIGSHKSLQEIPNRKQPHFFHRRNLGSSRFILQMSNVQSIASEDDLMKMVKLASSALPNRPDGTLVCVFYGSSEDSSSTAIHGAFDRLSTDHPDCIFLRCYREYRDAESFIFSRQLGPLPAFEVFYRGSLAARVDGPQLGRLEQVVRQLGFAVSQTNLFGPGGLMERQAPLPGPDGEEGEVWDRQAEDAARSRRRVTSRRGDALSTPRTTARFLPGGLESFGLSQESEEERRAGVDRIRGGGGPGSLQDRFQEERRMSYQERVKAEYGTNTPLRLPDDDDDDILDPSWPGLDPTKFRADDGMPRRSAPPPAGEAPAGNGGEKRGAEGVDAALDALWNWDKE